jgi:hypothetical protein
MSDAEALREAIYNYLSAAPALEAWGEEVLDVRVELRPTSPDSAHLGALWLSKKGQDFESGALLHKALARIRQGFERNEIQGWRGDLVAEPERVWIHDDPELEATVQTLEIRLTVAPVKP